MPQEINKNSVGLTPNLSNTFSDRKLVRVYDIILDETHEDYQNKNSIGVIRYGSLDLTIDLEDKNSIKNLNQATPINPHISYVPTKGELVRIEQYTSDNIYLVLH